MRHWITLYVVLKEIVLKQVSSRKSVKESITRSQVYVARRSPRQHVSANINQKVFSIVMATSGEVAFCFVLILPYPSYR